MMSTNLADVHANLSTGPRRTAQVLADLWEAAGLDPGALTRFESSGGEPAMPSSFAVGTAVQAALGAAALAGTEIALRRGAPPLVARVEMADVLRESACRFTIDGRTPPAWDKLSGLYRCGPDGAAGSWVRIHANFKHHRDGALALLGLPAGDATDRSAVEAALQAWDPEAFEAAAAARGLPVAALRTPAEWAKHPQAAAVAAEPLVRIERSADAAPLPWRTATELAAHPLAGVRVLELTRILAGPVAGRTLAALGADVLLINAAHLPNIEALADTSRGKLSALLDLRTPAGRETLNGLVRDCDVFLQGYRPGALAAHGFGYESLQRLRPGIVSVSLAAYGTQGPWAGRRGFDSLVQTATGFNIAEAQAFGEDKPRALPLQALDYSAGYLLAFGTLAALLHQRQRGGSWRVNLSLAGVGHWLRSLGRNADPKQVTPPGFDGELEESASGFGRLIAVRSAVQLGGQRLGWRRPSMPPGTHAPAWPA